MTKDKRRLDHLKAFHRLLDRSRKWEKIKQAGRNRIGEVRHLFEAVNDENSPGVSPKVLKEALDYLMGEYDEKPSCIPTAEEFSRRDAA